jgi:hypothetical protein
MSSSAKKDAVVAVAEATKKAALEAKQKAEALAAKQRIEGRLEEHQTKYVSVKAEQSSSSSSTSSSPSPRGSKNGGPVLTPRSASTTLGGMEKAKFTPTIPQRRRSTGPPTGGVPTGAAGGPSPAQALLNQSFKRERKQRDRKPLPAMPKEKGNIT